MYDLHALTVWYRLSANSKDSRFKYYRDELIVTTVRAVVLTLTRSAAYPEKGCRGVASTIQLPYSGCHVHPSRRCRDSFSFSSNSSRIWSMFMFGAVHVHAQAYVHVYACHSLDIMDCMYPGLDLDRELTGQSRESLDHHLVSSFGCTHN